MAKKTQKNTWIQYAYSGFVAFFSGALFTALLSGNRLFEIIGIGLLVLAGALFAAAWRTREDKRK